jgi:DNA-binding XRE family transcriptional regulator
VSPPGKPLSHGPTGLQVPVDLKPVIKRERRRLGQRLRKLRVELGLSQEQAAEMIGIHAKYMPRVEAGRANLTFDNLIAACVAYGVALRDLFPEFHDEGANK